MENQTDKYKEKECVPKCKDSGNAQQLDNDTAPIIETAELKGTSIRDIYKKKGISHAND